MAAMTTMVGARPAYRTLGTPRIRAIARAVLGAGILVAIVLEVGAEPFVRGIASLTPAGAAAALLLGAAVTAAAAWRWRVLAGRLGLALGWGASVSSYYRSQFLNAVLPGGVVGDIHRAVSHGRSVRQPAQASRAVVAERTAGQAVQLVLAAVVLVSLGSSAYAPAVGIVLLALAVACVGLVVAARASAHARRTITRELVTLRFAFGTIGIVVEVLVASTIVIAGLVAMFLVACLAVGVDASPDRLIAVALIAVLAGSIPLNIGGWGPREGAAAWAFAATGLGAGAGIAASTAFGVLALIAVVPGAAVVAASALRRRRGVMQGKEASS